MIVARILVDGKYYIGESTETYKTDCGPTGVWYPKPCHNLNKLVFGQGPTDHHGFTNIHGAIERILRRVSDGVITIKSLTVEIQEAHPCAGRPPQDTAEAGSTCV